MRVTAISKSKQKVNVLVSFKGTPDSSNARLPLSYFKEQITDSDNKCLGHIMKIDPSKPWGDIQIIVDVIEKDAIPAPPKFNAPGMIFIGDPSQLGCGICNKLNKSSATKCSECGNELIPEGTSVALDTKSLSGDGQMSEYFDIGI